MLGDAGELPIEVAGVVTGRNERFFGHYFYQEVRKSEAQFLALMQHRGLHRLTIQIGPVAGAKIAHAKLVSVNRQFAMPPAEPPIVNAQGDIHPPADRRGELVEHNFTRRSQRILADES